MAIKVIPDGSRKGGGGMDIATKRDALADKMSKAMTSAMRGPRGLSDQDVARALSRVRGMIRDRTKSDADKKAGGGKAMKKKKMMAGGGKTKKYMARGGKTKKYMARGGKAK